MRIRLLMFVLLLIGPVSARPTFAVVIEGFGNRRLAAPRRWPGLERVINHSSRVYYQWFNGSETCCFRGEPDDLNELLLRYAVVKAERLEVVLQRGGKEIKDSSGAALAVDCRIEFSDDIPGRALPSLTIYVSDRLPLDSIRIPKSLSVSDPQRLRERADAEQHDLPVAQP